MCIWAAEPTQIKHTFSHRPMDFPIKQAEVIRVIARIRCYLVDRSKKHLHLQRITKTRKLTQLNSYWKEKVVSVHVDSRSLPQSRMKTGTSTSTKTQLDMATHQPSVQLLTRTCKTTLKICQQTVLHLASPTVVALEEELILSLITASQDKEYQHHLSGSMRLHLGRGLLTISMKKPATSRSN